MQLVIVESPTKCKTIKKYLGKDYEVASSKGHIRDLPTSEIGVDVKNDFKPTYVIPDKAKLQVRELKKLAKGAVSIILATDEDREGEAIAFHIAHILKLDNPDRIVFHEITKSAIEKAIKNPRKLNQHLVDAQQARRILDRLVGYKLSPFLWKKVMRGLSAGRVQSVAVKLVCEKEAEIKAFKAEEYWNIEAILATKEQKEFSAMLAKKDDKPITKLGIKTEKESENILKDLEGAEYKIIGVERKETKRNPSPPFKTSTLQQTSSSKLGYGAKRTMMIAQKLYEKGFITYHRTDSLSLSQESTNKAKIFIESTYGKQYFESRDFKTKSKSAQEAHEAIRPAYPEKTPESLKLTPHEFKLYTLIWSRFLASQMTPAIFDAVAVDVSANKYTFRATGQTLKFDGFLKVYKTKFEENELPNLTEDEILTLKKLKPEQHFTQPPPRYSEATLIKALEKEGIGRPSTYAPTMGTIQARNYVEKNEQNKFQPTRIGGIVNDILVKHFPKIVNMEFTAKMEAELDAVAEGKDTFTETLRDFYTPFEKNLKSKEKSVEKIDLTEKTDKICPECKAPVLLRLGRYGKFYACSKFPNCKHTENLPKPTLGIKCPKCEKGEIVEKTTKKKKVFYGCSTWPKCDFAAWDKPVSDKKGNTIPCPECKSPLVMKNKKELKCSDKECG
ncbi:MAG: type I DNA topoisomerase, partial [Parcubacteria group bacterium]|nr:type I DNA topoisomerase [Parcubacteria group bacterium]